MYKESKVTDKKLKRLKIRKYSDFNVMINNRFEIIFYNNFGERHVFPLIIDESLEIKVPKYMHSINNFLNGHIDVLHGKDALKFLKFAKIDIVPFVWMIMQEGNLNIYWNHSDIYIKNQNEFIVLNSKNINLAIIERMYKTQNKTYLNGIYRECLDELYTYIRKKISNSIVHNDIIKLEIDRFKDIEKELESEFLNDEYNFSKMLFLYEKLIRLKEKYTNEQFFLKPLRDIDEIYEKIQKIREILQQDNENEYSIIKK
ncbi:hypothetical protein [Alkaliphilus sp. B6464]|uniref:hypothetical protein n=1 Tax=Alkaliphilus sp. B6464 TaxID=2731219 RepID=UPI001BA7DDE5|nr:hypothetical protein [Alkaliphilus sp. B6464]QUH22049.1 hypothetical protein HYG84_19275 [Alkaliphilus sp. B6464]